MAAFSLSELTGHAPGVSSFDETGLPVFDSHGMATFPTLYSTSSHLTEIPKNRESSASDFKETSTKPTIRSNVELSNSDSDNDRTSKTSYSIN